MIYPLHHSVLLSLSRIQGGSPVTGLSVSVTVYNAKTGAVLLTSIATSEVHDGIYAYEWEHGLTTRTECVARWAYQSKIEDEFFTLDDTIEHVDNADGRAV